MIHGKLCSSFEATKKKVVQVNLQWAVTDVLRQGLVTRNSISFGVRWWPCINHDSWWIQTKIKAPCSSIENSLMKTVRSLMLWLHRVLRWFFSIPILAVFLVSSQKQPARKKITLAKFHNHFIWLMIQGHRQLADFVHRTFTWATLSSFLLHLAEVKRDYWIHPLKAI